MTKLALIAFASAATLALVGCGDADDASEAAMADTVEMPADQALANTPEPAAAPIAEAGEETDEAVTATATDSAEAAEAAAADAAAAAEAATEGGAGAE